MTEILRSIEGNLLGLDKDDNLLVKGSKIILNHLGTEIVLAPESRVWLPSDMTGATDMTTELEAFVAANQGYTVKVPDSATILLKNAFKLVTTGHILLDFGQATILYDHSTSSDFAIYCTNVANAGAETAVASLALATVNNDATVSQVTLSTTASGSRFDWFALYSTDANPAKSGGFLGEIFQLLAAESSLVLTATRVLNRHAFYTAGLNVRKLDASRRVDIRGGIFRANGDTEDQSITARATAIYVLGFVYPSVTGVMFDRPWSTGLRFQACAGPQFSYTIKDVGNLADYNGYTYGCTLYGMNDAAYGYNIRSFNCRHGFTTDGNSGNTTTWYNKGIPTNGTIDGMKGTNCHGSVCDTHEEGDNFHFTNISGYYSYQDADISPNYSGAVCVSRCSRSRFSNIFCYGGTNAVKVTAVDHGFEDHIYIDNLHVRSTTKGAAADSDIGINIGDQSSLTNKRHVHLSNAVFDDVGKCVVVSRSAKFTCGNVLASRIKTWLDASEAAECLILGDVTLDFRNSTRTAQYNCNVVRSSLTLGGATVIYMRKPVILKGDNANKPTSFFGESDTNATKTVYAPGIVEYNPSAVTSTQLYATAQTTFSIPTTMKDLNHRSVRVHTSGTLTISDTDNVVVVNKTVAGATAGSIPAPGLRNRAFVVKDGKGDAAANNITLTPASGTIDGAATRVISANYGVVTLVDNGTEWNVI